MTSKSKTPEQHWADGEAAGAKGLWKQALVSYDAALAVRPDHVPALLGASWASGKLGRHRDAVSHVLAAYNARPTSPSTIFALGQRLRYFNEYARCLEVFGWPAFVERAPPRALAEAAVSLSSMGANAAARRLIDRALKVDPKNAAALYFSGNLHTFMGDNAPAEASYEKALDIDPRLYQCSWMLSSLRTQTPDRNHLQRLRMQRGAAVRGQRGEMYVCYALHKECHDLGLYDEAWDALARALEIERNLSSYSLRESIRAIDELKRLPLGLASPASTIVQPCVPIFIVGMFRSGTTLLERMLAGHSQVADGGETMAFAEQLKRTGNRGYRGLVDADAARAWASADFDALARGYTEPLAWLSRGCPFVTEKLPSNFLLVAHIAKALPQARFLHLVRDPMDTCFANLRTLLSDDAGYSTSQQWMGEYFNAYRSLMSHWRRVFPGLILDVVYDELVADPERVMRDVSAHCGLEFEPGMLDVSRASGAVATASATQVRGGIVKNRGGAWRPYERHLQPLIATLQAAG